MLLTQEERLRFLAYLDNEIATGRGVIEQMEKIGVPDFVVKHFRTEILAAEVIANKLRKTESITVEPEQAG